MNGNVTRGWIVPATHLVTNILVEDGQTPDELTVRSTFLVRQARKLRDEAWWAGRRHD